MAGGKVHKEDLLTWLRRIGTQPTAGDKLEEEKREEKREEIYRRGRE